MLPSRFGASEDFSTSAPEITSEGSTSNANSRPSPSVASSRPFRVTMLNSGPSPRTLTYWPSPPRVRRTVMPVMCDSESATLSSGKLPRSSATIESCTIFAPRLRSSDSTSAARVPVTTTSLEFGCRRGARGLGACELRRERDHDESGADEASDETHGHSP